MDVLLIARHVQQRRLRSLLIRGEAKLAVQAKLARKRKESLQFLEPLIQNDTQERM